MTIVVAGLEIITRTLHIRLRVHLCIVLVMVATWQHFGAGSDQHLSPPAEHESTPISGSHKDFGEVSIDHGARTVEHVFSVINRSSKTLMIRDVVPSCGCLDAIIGTHTLLPGETTTLRVKATISQPGRFSQTTRLVLDDGSTAAFTISANAARTSRMTLVPQRMIVDRQPSRVRIRLYVVDNSCRGAVAPPIVRINDEMLPIEFDGWKSLEECSAEPLRPKRQVATLVLPHIQSIKHFPVEVTITTDLGVSNVLLLERYD